MDRANRQRAEEVLSREGWLAGESAAFRAEVFQWAVAVTAPAGAVLCRVGDGAGGIYGVASGALSVSLAAEGEVRQLQHGARGGWVGVVPFLTGGPRAAELRAVTDCLLMHLSLPAMEAMAARDPAAIRAFARIALANLASALELVQILLAPGAERRVAAILLRAARSGVDPLPLTQAELAAMANASARQVNVALRKLAREGLIAQGYRAIRILDAAALRARAEGAP